MIPRSTLADNMAAFKMIPERLEALAPMIDANRGALVDIFVSSSSMFRSGYQWQANLTNEENFKRFDEHQVSHRDITPQPQGAFDAIRHLDALRHCLPPGYDGIFPVRVNLATHQSYDAGGRTERALEKFGIPYEMAFFNTGQPLLHDVAAQGGHTFFNGSLNRYSFADAIEAGVTPIHMLPREIDPTETFEQFLWAKDWDATAAHDASEAIFQLFGLEVFTMNELMLRHKPMGLGPAAPLLISILLLRSLFPDSPNTSPLLTAFLTARGGPAGQRVRETFDDWRDTLEQWRGHGVKVDFARKLGGRHKGKTIAAMMQSKTHHRQAILIDDHDKHGEAAVSSGAAAGIVPNNVR